MKTLNVVLLLLAFAGLAMSERCCPETDLGILCENSTARTKPKCRDDEVCCLRLDLAYTCCNEETQFCNPSQGGCIPISGAPLNLIPVKIGIFGESLALAIARTRFLWVQEGLNVTYVVVRGSANQFQLVQNNSVDIISTAVDNTINYNLNPNNPSIGALVKTVAIAATDLGTNNAIVVRPNITSFNDLRNTIVGVDAAASGFAYLVYDILASGGLVYQQDYIVREIGGGAIRLQALLAGTVSAVLLSGEQLITAQRAGMILLRSYADIKAITLSGVLAATPTFLQRNATVINKFLRAYYVATQYLVNPNNRNAIINLITAANVSVDPTTFYEYSVSPLFGTKADAIITTQGLYDIIASRNRYNGFEAGQLSNRTICSYLDQSKGLYNLKYLEKAVNSLGYSFRNRGSLTCRQLGLRIEEESSAFSFVMPMALIASVMIAILLI